jgi:hypothetical protein
MTRIPGKRTNDQSKFLSISSQPLVLDCKQSLVEQLARVRLRLGVDDHLIKSA